MSMPVINNCPCTLAEGYDTYSPIARRLLFAGRPVSHILPYEAPWSNDRVTEKFMDNTKRISLSGVQEKYSLLQEKKELRLTREGEQGSHILKPMPLQLKRPREVPANEHVTMQIASQVYGIHTAAAAVAFFQNGEAAYITRRFDINPSGTKRAKEDFATLAGRSVATAGKNFKYDASYEEIGTLIKKYVAAWPVEVERFFSLVVFNYLFSNGDAHLKNFAILETDNGDFTLSPAYDLVNTRLHIEDDDFALNKGLFDDGFRSKAYLQHGQVAGEDFKELGKRLDISTARCEKLLARFLVEQPAVVNLVNRSFLEAETKTLYLTHYRSRLKNINV